MSDLDRAARLAAQAVLNGDLPTARHWALQFAMLRDSEATRAEQAVILDGWRVRRETWEATRAARQQARLDELAAAAGFGKVIQLPPPTESAPNARS